MKWILPLPLFVGCMFAAPPEVWLPSAAFTITTYLMPFELLFGFFVFTVLAIHNQTYV